MTNKLIQNNTNYKFNKSYEEKVEERSNLLNRKIELEKLMKNCSEAVPHSLVDEYQTIINKLLQLV